MTWITWLMLAVVVTAVAAVTGIKPKGTRPVAHTRLLGIARVVLLFLFVVFVYLAYRVSGTS